MNISLQNKQFWMSNVIIMASLAGVIFFPTYGGFQSIITNITFLVALPVLFIKFLLKTELSFFGVTWGNVARGMFWLILSLLMVIGAFIIFHEYVGWPSFIKIPLSVQKNFLVFLVYIIGTSAIFVTQEFFFRGFILNVYRKMFGYGAIVAQALFTTLLLLINTRGKMDISTMIISVLSIYAGWIAYRSQSIWYSFFFFFISAILGIVVVLVFVR